MQREHKKWKRQIRGNDRLFYNVKNPLRNYVEKQIKGIDLSSFPNRPQKLVDLSIGDPTNSEQFRTHKSNFDIIQQNVGRVDGYTNFQGLDEAREALVNRFSSPQYKINKDNVFMTAGGSLAIWTTIMLLAQEGDNFLFPSPGFPLSGVIADSLGVNLKLYHLQPNDHWKASIAEMESLIDERTKFIYVNDPSNPLGACWSEEHKKEIIDLCRRKNLPLVADQIYEGVTYQESVKTFAQLSSDDVTIFKCSGLTKRWLGPGWRCGWLIVYANEENFKKYWKYLKGIFNILLMPHTIMQASLKSILENNLNEEHLQSRLQIMKTNGNMLVEQLDKLPCCTVGSAAGALYGTIILKFQNFTEEIPNTVEFCKKLFAEENIMIFPGKFFYSEEPFVRLTISCATPIIEQFILRFRRFCEKYEKK